MVIEGTSVIPEVAFIMVAAKFSEKKAPLNEGKEIMLRPSRLFPDGGY